MNLLVYSSEDFLDIDKKTKGRKKGKLSKKIYWFT